VLVSLEFGALIFSFSHKISASLIDVALLKRTNLDTISFFFARRVTTELFGLPSNEGTALEVGVF
jgi:hypothetical protein